MICSTSLPLRAGVVDAFWNSRKRARTSLWSCFSMTMASWDMSAPRGGGRRGAGHRPGGQSRRTRAPRRRNRRGRGTVWVRKGLRGPSGRRGSAVRAPSRGRPEEGPWPEPSATPSSSAPARTVSSPPTRSPTPGGTSCSSRPRTRWAAPCAARRASPPASSPTCSAPSTPSRRRAPSSATCTSSGTGSCGATPRPCWPMRSPTAGAASCTAPRPTPQRAWTSTTPGDGDAWLRMVAGWDRVRDPLLDALFTPFPPVRSGSAAAAPLGRGRHARPHPARPALGAAVRPRGVRQRGGPGPAQRQRHAQRRAARRRRERPLRLAPRHARAGRRLPGARGRRRDAGHGAAAAGGVARGAGALRGRR